MNNPSVPVGAASQTAIPMRSSLPVAIVGAGPVGLAAAAHLIEYGLTPLILERGSSAGNVVRSWGHVRVFTPWTYAIDSAARALLESTGWSAPSADDLPTGDEIVRRYLEPLAKHPKISPHLVFDANVFAIGREGFAKTTTAGRELAPFIVRWIDSAGHTHETRAQAVVDASGTWLSPNPMGVDGHPVRGEPEAGGRIAYGIPDVFGSLRADYAGRSVLVVGSGHSAIHAVLDLLRLQEAEPATRIAWALRHADTGKLFGGGLDDKLPARGSLGLAAKAAIESGKLSLLAPFAAERIEDAGSTLRVTGRLGLDSHRLTVDRIVVATGFRPDIGMLRELRVTLDPVLEAPPALAPLIDPNVHSCGTVPPHGAAELGHPEPGFYIVGSKSYGRAPTFLMATGYEQVRSVVAEIAGDHEAAREVRLVLPETGVCGVAPNASQASAATSACCGGPTPEAVDACCAEDAEAKVAGKSGCGCGSTGDNAAALKPQADGYVRASKCCG